MNKLDIVPSNRFKKDLKLAKRRGYDLGLLEETVENLPFANNYHRRIMITILQVISLDSVNAISLPTGFSSIVSSMKSSSSP